MLSFEKDIIINYAKKNKIKWSEDSSNRRIYIIEIKSEKIFSQS